MGVFEYVNEEQLSSSYRTFFFFFFFLSNILIVRWVHLYYSKWHVYMLINISANLCTTSLKFIDVLNYLHNYELSSLLQFVSCGLAQAREPNV